MTSTENQPAENSQVENKDFSNVSYWNQYYTDNTEQFDWFQPWEFFKKYLCNRVTLGGNALNVGCGNSTLGKDLLEHFDKIVNIDYSQTVIDQMKDKYKDIPNLEWITTDCLKIELEEQFFDCIFDKGTFDCLTCDSESNEKVKSYLNEIDRLLTPYGTFVLISFAPEIARKRYFKEVSKQLKVVSVIPIPKPELKNAFYYVYLLMKNNTNSNIQ